MSKICVKEEETIMKQSFGERLSILRKAKKLTQEQVADHLKVSPQAVSKWENDISYPDITLLAALAELLDVSIDQLLAKENKPDVEMVEQEKRKDVNKMILRVNVISQSGDKVKINLPLPLIIAGLDMGITPNIGDNKALQNVDFKKIIELVEQGAVGKLVDIETSDGDIVEVTVE
jgi:transcriptional regulator with XRE-family HTH domain